MSHLIRFQCKAQKSQLHFDNKSRCELKRSWQTSFREEPHRALFISKSARPWYDWYPLNTFFFAQEEQSACLVFNWQRNVHYKKKIRNEIKTSFPIESVPGWKYKITTWIPAVCKYNAGIWIFLFPPLPINNYNSLE